MSHIVKGKVKVAYTDKNLLMKALAGLGTIHENERLYRVGVGQTSERYQLVLIDAKHRDQRIGWNLENGVWQQYQENWGEYGQWTQRISSSVQDRYLAYHYEKELAEEGYQVSIKQHYDGTLELEAMEATW